MIYLFLGPPASGKGTQAKLLAHKLNLPFYSIGALLRVAGKADAGIAQKINEGQLVSDDLVCDIFETIHQKHSDNLVLDGFIRTPHQVDMAVSVWDRAKLTVILLELPDEVIFTRSQERILTDGTRRIDDAGDVVKKRVADYREQASVLETSLRDHGIICIPINGNAPIEKIHQDIMAKVTSL